MATKTYGRSVGRSEYSCEVYLGMFEDEREDER